MSTMVKTLTSCIPQEILDEFTKKPAVEDNGTWTGAISFDEMLCMNEINSDPNLQIESKRIMVRGITWNFFG